MTSLLETQHQIRVSSILNKEVLSYGKQFLTDNKDDTCWCSDQGTPQWIAFNFKQTVKIESLLLQFQGGFVGKHCSLELIDIQNEKTELSFYPEDNNLLQKFEINSQKPCNRIVINFNNSTDFFGRIIVYNIDLIGEKCSEFIANTS